MSKELVSETEHPNMGGAQVSVTTELLFSLEEALIFHRSPLCKYLLWSLRARVDRRSLKPKVKFAKVKLRSGDTLSSHLL